MEKNILPNYKGTTDIISPNHENLHMNTIVLIIGFIAVSAGFIIILI